MIEATNINKCYGDRYVLKDINMSINTKDITVLIGPSGSGKTTLLNCLSLILNPTSGEIRSNGVNYKFPQTEKINNQFRRNGKNQFLGFVFQDLHLLPHWTNYENIVFPLGKSFDQSAKEKLDTLINTFSMNRFIHNYPNESSKGEEQRVALCRAIMLNPTFLFLDEVTSALDPEQIVSVLNYCITMKEEGKGLLIVTHYIPFAMKAADKVLFIDNGVIVESGEPDILKRPATDRLKKYLESLKSIIYE